MTNKETIQTFIDRINAHDVEGLAELMSDDHTTFVDAHGNRIEGRDLMIVGWRVYFEMFPDYAIEVNEIFEQGDTFAMFGFAGGSCKGKAENSWNCRLRGKRL